MYLSYPTRGTWVEIIISHNNENVNKSYPTRGTWVEILIKIFFSLYVTSYPTRGTWVEIGSIDIKYRIPFVVPHTGYVSWNCYLFLCHPCPLSRTPHGVRELKFKISAATALASSSYPTRGTWVEILLPECQPLLTMSYPTRGTWVEMIISNRSICITV